MTKPHIPLPDVDTMAQAIRLFDGAHDLGAGALAEKLVAWLAQSALSEPVVITELRATAMAVYQPPFKHTHGYIYDAQSNMVADDGGLGSQPSIAGAVAARVRGWGRLGYLPEGDALQDEIGRLMADALNEYYALHGLPDWKVPTETPPKVGL